jgi:hypothetical protein
MLDSDLAELYGVETKALVRAVKRNSERFPVDFMVQLTKEEFDNLKYHFGTSRWGGRRYLPYAFTEQGDSNAFKRFEQQASDSGQHRNYESFRKASGDDCIA